MRKVIAWVTGHVAEGLRTWLEASKSELQVTFCDSQEAVEAVLHDAGQEPPVIVAWLPYKQAEQRVIAAVAEQVPGSPLVLFGFVGKNLLIEPFQNGNGRIAYFVSGETTMNEMVAAIEAAAK